MGQDSGLMEKEIAIYDIKKREELINKIIDLIEEQGMSQVEAYGVLDHCKFIIFNDSMRDCIIETIQDYIDEQDKDE